MIKIICPGKIKEKYLRQAVDDYIKRISKYHKIEIIELEDSNITKEGEKILRYIDNKDYVITIEIEGNNITSEEFAATLDKIFITNSKICFVIGGSYGLSEDVKARSNYRLSFSSFTFPHQLFRVILLEQVYRAFKILNNETSHK